MDNRLWLVTFILTVVPSSMAAPVDEKRLVEDAAELRVRLRLNTIEGTKLWDHYEWLFKRELGLQDSVRACIKSGDERLQQYQQSLKETQDDLEKTKKKLIEVELERVRVLERLGKRGADEITPESIEKINRTLEKILQRLDNIEKWLDKREK